MVSLVILMRKRWIISEQIQTWRPFPRTALCIPWLHSKLNTHSFIWHWNVCLGPTLHGASLDWAQAQDWPIRIPSNSFPLQPKDQLCNKRSSVLTFDYTYDASAGRGVDIYIVGEFQRGVWFDIRIHHYFRHWWGHLQSIGLMCWLGLFLKVFSLHMWVETCIYSWNKIFWLPHFSRLNLADALLGVRPLDHMREYMMFWNDNSEMIAFQWSRWQWPWNSLRVSVDSLILPSVIILTRRKL